METKEQIAEKIEYFNKNRIKICNEQGHYYYAEQFYLLYKKAIKLKDLTDKEKKSVKKGYKLSKKAFEMIKKSGKMMNKVSKIREKLKEKINKRLLRQKK